MEYWIKFNQYLEEHSTIIKPTKGLPQHWMNIAIGRSHFKLIAMVDNRVKRMSTGLIISGPDAKAFFHLLVDDKEKIEEGFGNELLWRGLPHKKESQILLRHPEKDPNDRSKWSNQHALLCKTLETFHRVFSKRVKELNADDYQPPEENGD